MSEKEGIVIADIGSEVGNIVLNEEMQIINLAQTRL